jgi:glycosyltransferase involved in cell wall biosynthesis
MKIALYQPWIYLHGGLEKSLLELVTRSSHDWVVYTGHYEPENTFKEFSRVDVRVLNQTTVKRTIGGTLYSSLQVAMQQIPDEGYDAIVVWCDGIGDLLTFRNHHLPIFNICSTPLRAAFDPVYEEMALKNKSGLYAVLYKTFKSIFRVVDRAAWSHYDGIITTSTEVKTRIIDGKLCNDESKMLMAYPGIDWQNDLSNMTYEPFMLVPGRIMWTKNIQQAIEAFIEAALPKPWKLVVAGYVDAKSQSYLQDLKEMVPAGVNVEFIVSPSSEALKELYKTASFCLFPPLNEDWGIVPLESMSHGKSVIANARGGPLESIQNNQTGFLLEPNDKVGWANAIRKLALDPNLCQEMGLEANKQMQNFTWQQFVLRIDKAFTQWVDAKRKYSNRSTDNSAMFKKKKVNVSR